MDKYDIIYILKLDSTILLYSVNTQLSYYISENFYSQHFVWCSPVFNSDVLDSMHVYKKIPPSSNPFTIYHRCRKDIEASDLHSPNITQNKAGLKRGAIEMLKCGKIDEADFFKINAIIDSANIDQYSPLLYLIPRYLVEKRIKLVDVDKTANPLSVEYQIADLKRNEFEVIKY